MDSLYLDSVRWVQTLFTDTHAEKHKKWKKKITRTRRTH